MDKYYEFVIRKPFEAAKRLEKLEHQLTDARAQYEVMFTKVTTTGEKIQTLETENKRLLTCYVTSTHKTMSHR